MEIGGALVMVSQFNDMPNSMQLRIVTVADKTPKETYYCFDEMKRSCAMFGYDTMVIGWGKPWGGLGSKPRSLLNAIVSGEIPEKYIIFLDAFDVVLARDPQEILEAYKESGTGILWNAERNCFPLAELAPLFPEAAGGFRYLNSGFCVAETEALLTYLLYIRAEDIPDDHRNPDGSMNHPNDQAFALKAFTETPQCVPMKLDTEGRVCAALCGVGLDELSFDGPRIKLLPTGSEPMAFHANGPAKDSGIMPPILAKLGLR